MGDVGVEWLKNLLNRILAEVKIAEDWGDSELVTIYKEKGDSIECSNYRGIKLLEHGLKVLEKMLDKRLRQMITIDRMQLGSSPSKGTADAIFMKRQAQEKMLEKNKTVYMAFLDLEKAYDGVPREVLYWSLRKKGAPEYLVKMVEATYEGARIKVRTEHGNTEACDIKVGVHQGSALSPFLFITVIDTLSAEARTEIPWELIFPDDIALMARTKGELQRKLTKWQEALYKGGLKMNTRKVEMMVLRRKGRQAVTVRDLDRAELKQVQEVKYLGAEIDSEGGTTSAIKQRIKAAWRNWREVTGIICDRKMPRELNCKVYKTVVRPALLYGAESLAVGKKDEDLMSRAEMGMLRWILGVSRLEKLRNEEIRRRCGVADIVEKMWDARLRWVGHVLRRGVNELSRVVLEFEVEGNRGRGRGRPRRRWRECLKKDVEMRGWRRPMRRRGEDGQLGTERWTP